MIDKSFKKCQTIAVPSFLNVDLLPLFVIYNCL